MTMVSDRLFNRGVLSVVNAQFFSALADNALFFALLELLDHLGALKESTYLLQACFLAAYILLAPFVGLFADNQSKSRVLMLGNGAKLLGVALLFVGASPFVAYAIVGIGAAIYSPAKFGILSELVTTRLLVKVNGLVEGSTILAILLGAYVGGLLAEWNMTMAFLFAGLMYGVALIFNVFIPKIKRARHDSFTPSALLKSFGEILWRLLRDPGARFAILGTSLFWGAATTLRLLLNDWVREVLGGGTEMVAALSAIVSIGIVVGALLASLFITIERLRYCLWAGLMMGILCVLFAYQTDAIMVYGLLICIGAMGGLFVIPMNALLQTRGQSFESTGTAIAVQNFAENSVMIIMMVIFGVLAAQQVPVLALMVSFGLFFMLGVVGLFIHLRCHCT
ncbi:lysophospholipid transporter LplT [Wohlfahrtiimonas chitiniclastica]|uniref:lysophospholipid transporter LplT n=1 Tax=Wohlfahrtiimonas chitiniclastica TaxID=400946 RepID=UPI000B984E41|nr:lysophospholipid transporter LplT [Wohlfahrtiimonas chitiniclastica]OYQ70026.1 lysophospholipid transporter LplT [Wohlfahrtiimonas chitiniclastica]OYQ79679.1 lysophospholipid transporter LplT [Wohlfahrtiimonas chitiniclastica]OYQ83271.1 lysophospholipid transporter LplT [Wohlfahrtiimonas chitiniclastica]OYQ84243.1 lysophospholipid transporter LplT [Wohlfahrtiimonas chitiniclastica]